MAFINPDSPLTRCLVLSPDNPSNTTILDASTDLPLYHVSTIHSPQTLTIIHRATDDDQSLPLASWTWHDFNLFDSITLGAAPPISVSSWLRKSLLPFKYTVKLTDSNGRKFKWKGNAPGLTLQLFADDDKKVPIVRFEKSRKVTNHFATGVTPKTPAHLPARLLLDQTRVNTHTQDLAVISFLVLERSRRIADVESQNRASAIALGALSDAAR